MEYAYQPKKGANPRIARARLTGINASYKDLCEVCRNVRGKDTEWALNFLEEASVGEKAIYFVRHCKGKGHRRQLGGKKGGWPMKSVKFVLLVVQSAAANATKLGLGNTKVSHIIANKQETYPRMSPKGRRIRQDFETAFIEVVLEEYQPKPESGKAGVKNAASEKPKEQPKSEQKANSAPEAETKKVEQKKSGAKQQVTVHPEKQAKQKEDRLSNKIEK